MRHFKTFLLTFLLCSGSFFAQKDGESFKIKRINYLSDNKKQNMLDSAVERTVVDFMQSPQNCGLSIGIIKDGTSYFYNYGEIKRDTKVLPSKNTLFEIGSITKTFCGIVLACAVVEGKVRLEDDIRKYLPEKYPNLEMKHEYILLKHLANHTSGLPRLPDNLEFQPNYDSLNPYKNYNKKMVFDFLKTVKLNSEPGKVCEYSNLGMALLGIILERIYNKSFEEIVKEKICIPNNLNNTTITLTAEQTSHFAEGYNNNGNVTPHWDLGDLSAAGGLKSCTADMLNYLKYNLDENDAAVKLSHQSTYNNGSNVGLAWHIINKNNDQLIWHNGGTFGFTGFCGFMKEKKLAVIILSNSATSVDYIGLSIFKFLQKGS